MTTPTCRCGQPTELRKKYGLSGGTVVRYCPSCARIERLSARELRQLSDAEIRSLRTCSAKRKPQPTARKRIYQAALKSPHWKKLRALVFERAKGRCEVEGCSNEATVLGHLHYETLGKETEQDVRAECQSCSLGERELRITRGVLG